MNEVLSLQIWLLVAWMKSKLYKLTHILVNFSIREDHVTYLQKNSGDMQYDFLETKNIIFELIVVSTPGTLLTYACIETNKF